MKNKNLLPWLLIPSALFAVLLMLFPVRSLVELQNSTFLGMFWAVMVALYPLVKRALCSEKPDRVDLLVTSWALAWVCMFLSQINSTVISSRIATRDVLLPLIALKAFIGILSGGLFLYSAGMDGDKWRYNRWHMVAAAIFGIIVWCVTMYLQRYGVPSL